jgi:hypothetical protein
VGVLQAPAAFLAENGRSWARIGNTDPQKMQFARENPPKIAQQAGQNLDKNRSKTGPFLTEKRRFTT